MNKTMVLFIFIFISSCSHNVDIYEKIDKSKKTVTVPAGSKGLKGKLKRVFSKRHWKMSVYGGPAITEGELGKRIYIKQYNTFNTKYRLLVQSKQFDVCFNFTPAIVYEISLINNNSGSEVFTIDGRGCESEVIEKFVKALDGSSK